MTSEYEPSHPMQPVPTPHQVRLLWASVLAAPVVALGDLQAGYTLALLACSRGLRWLPLVSTLVALAASAAAIWYAHAFGGHGPERRRGVSPADGEPTSNGWVAVVAVSLNLMTILVVLAMAVPRLVLDPCWR